MSRKATQQSTVARRVKQAVLGSLLGVLLLGGIAYGADLALNQGKIPRGTTVGGVLIGGLTSEEAASKLEEQLQSLLEKPVIVHAGDYQAQLDPKVAGLGIDVAQTLAGAGDQPLNPFVRVRSFLSTHEIPIVSQVDQVKLDPELDRLTAELTKDPVDGGVILEDGKVVIRPEPANGTRIERAWLATSVPTEWLDPDGVTVDASILVPEYTAEKVQRVVDGEAALAVSAPITVHGRDGVDGVIPPQRMGEVVRFVPDQGEFKVEVDHEVAQNILLEQLQSTIIPRKNADISFTGSGRSITPHQDGVKIDWEATFAGFDARVIGNDPRSFDAIYVDDPATFTVEMAKVATFDEVAGEFTTQGYSAASGVNIARVAEIVDGAIVAPGDVFSLNGYTGPRGVAQGFVESGVILNGRADTAVGGGISQFATTLYNAAYFAGMEDVSHTPHSYYISRYPAGREATVYEGSIDLKFKNTSKYPVRIVTSVGGGSVTVKLMGVKTVNVESRNGGRWAPTQPHTVTVPAAECSPSGGAPGFSTSDTRIVRDLQGNELFRETQTTVYNPSPIVRCG